MALRFRTNKILLGDVMIIYKNNMAVNLDCINSFWLSGTIIGFSNDDSFYFLSKEEAKEAFYRILACKASGHLVCDLTKDEE
jgi:hypothetical protein